MLTKEENERLTRVGPGTPMGELLRRYWHPVGCSALVTSKPQRVKVLDEELVLYRGASGEPVLMELRCAHRNVALDYGRVEGDAIRCPYHGWLYAKDGSCIAQPCDSDADTFPKQFSLKAYKTQEVSGLIFAYMGPEPAPLLPLYDLLRAEGGIKQVRITNIAANFLQNVENILDVSHFSWLHGYTFPQFGGGKRNTYKVEPAHYGLDMQIGVEGGDSERGPYLFPCTNRFALPVEGAEDGLMHVILYRAPIDDYSHLNYFLGYIKNSKIPADPNRPVPASVAHNKLGEYMPLEGDWWGIDLQDQDRMAIEQQGPISDRTREHLVGSDVGIAMLRRLLREALDAVERGEDPIHVIRDPAQQNVDFPMHTLGNGKAPPEVETDYAVGLFEDASAPR